MENTPFDLFLKIVDTWQDGGVGVLLPDLIQVELKKEEDIKEWVSSIRKLRTLLARNRGKFYANPGEAHEITRAILISFSNLFSEHKFPDYSDFDQDIEKVMSRLEIEGTLSELPESSLFNTQFPEYWPQLRLASRYKDIEIQEDIYEGILRGGAMISILTQGLFLGFSTYLSLCLKMLQDGNDPKDIKKVINNQLGIAAIGLSQDNLFDEETLVNGNYPRTKAKYTAFVSPNVIQTLDKGEYVSVVSPQSILYDEIISSGGTIRSILREIRDNLENQRNLKFIRIVDSMRRDWQYRYNENTNTHIWWTVDISPATIELEP